jgi:hypothetical protein
MLQLSDDALVEVARQLVIEHSALGNEHGHLDLAFYIPLKPTKDGEKVVPTIGLVEIISKIPFAEFDRLDDRMQGFGFNIIVEEAASKEGDLRYEITSPKGDEEYNCVVKKILLRPEELEQVNGVNLAFPSGWDFSVAVDISPVTH